jgi:thiamine-phosphate pyrophosphorylase
MSAPSLSEQPPRVIQITDESALGRAALWARIDRVASLPAEARARFAVQLRDPGLDTRALAALGCELRARTKEIGAMLVVNDRIDLALALDADGVQLGRRSLGPADARRVLGPRAWIACSCHELGEIEPLVREGADALLLAPVLGSPGKGAPLGLDTLRAARARMPPGILLCALGGVTVALAADCFAAGAGAVASIRADLTALLTSPDAPALPTSPDAPALPVEAQRHP